MKSVDSYLVNDNRNILILIGIWVGLMFVINPIGDFPLNDDWSYAIPVQSLLNGNGIQFTGWMSMTLFAQVLWGALWCKVFGFSFTVLRFSTLFLGGVGIIYSYKLIREFVENKQTVFLLSLLVLFNPIYLNMSYTFMTEIPFYTTSVLSIYYYSKFIKHENLKHLILATSIVIVSILIRQLSLVIPLALLLIGIYNFIKSRKINVSYILPFVICVAVYLLYQKVAIAEFGAGGRYEERNNMFIDLMIKTPFRWLIGVFNRNIIGLLYVILFVSPLVFSFFVKSKSKIVLISIIGGGLFALFLNEKDYIFPILDNIIYNYGLGPATLYDYWFRDAMSQHQIHSSIWIVITLFVSILFVFVLIELGKNIKKIVSKLDTEILFVALILLGYTALIGSVPNYDRYYLLPIPLFIILVFNFLDIKIYKLAFYLLLIPLMWFGVAGTHDYLSWNKARWMSIDYLMNEKNISSAKIDGGFEFNGWYNYNDVDFDSGLKNMWVHDVDYIITFNQLKGTDIVYEESYSRWFRFDSPTVKVLKKNNQFDEMPDLFYADDENFKD